MEEKKKRFRPTLTAYRELEKKVSELMEGNSRLVKDCDAWRDKFRQLQEKFDSCDKGTLMRKLSEAEAVLAPLRNENESLSREIRDLSDEIERLKGRGLLARVFNL